jgi:hypothetical protein
MAYELIGIELIWSPTVVLQWEAVRRAVNNGRVRPKDNGTAYDMVFDHELPERAISHIEAVEEGIENSDGCVVAVVSVNGVDFNMAYATAPVEDDWSDTWLDYAIKLHDLEIKLTDDAEWAPLLGAVGFQGFQR